MKSMFDTEWQEGICTALSQLETISGFGIEVEESAQSTGIQSISMAKTLHWTQYKSEKECNLQVWWGPGKVDEQLILW